MIALVQNILEEIMFFFLFLSQNQDANSLIWCCYFIVSELHALASSDKEREAHAEIMFPLQEK